VVPAQPPQQTVAPPQFVAPAQQPASQEGARTTAAVAEVAPPTAQLAAPGGQQASRPTNHRPVARNEAREQRVDVMEEDEDLQAAIALSLAADAKTHNEVPKLVAPIRPSAPLAKEQPGSGSGGELDPTDAAQDEANRQLTMVLANCVATGQPFIDDTFVPAPKSLYVNGRCRQRDAQRLAVVQHFGTHADEIQWLNAGEILQRPDDLQMEFASQQEMVAMMHQFAKYIEWKVFQSDPSPSDISQGGLGNCWFCGSLAAVAEKPELIRRLFVDPHSKDGNLSPEGIYVVRLCDGGTWRYQMIDGLLPCNKMRMLAFSGARRNQLWVPLIEKAYAKLRGCYEAMEAGTPAEGLRLFTGWPSILQELRPAGSAEEVTQSQALRTQAVCPFADEDMLWLRLESAFDSKLIICGSCGHVDGISDEEYRSVGLSPSHCYSIVKVATARQGTLRLLKLRNPWGTGRKWTGQYSDSDTENWSPELKAEVGAMDLGAEGVFWMSLQDIRKYFASITICPFRDGWAEARRVATWPASAVSGNQPAFLLESPKQEVLLSIMQPEERASRTMMTADAGLVLFKLPPGVQVGPNDSTLKSLKGATMVESLRRRVQDSLVSNCYFDEAGGPERSSQMLAVPIAFNQRSSPTAPGNDKDFTFACFSPQPLRKLRTIALTAEVHREAVVAMVKKIGRRTRLALGVDVYEAKDTSGLVVLMENLTVETVMVEGHLTGVFNLQVSRGLVSTTDGEQSLHYRDTIPPMHGMVTFIAAAMPGGHNFTYRSECRILHHMEELHDPPLAAEDVLHLPFFLEGMAAITAPQPRRAHRGW